MKREPSPRTGRASHPPDLPLRAPLIRGETTASYLARTAAANGVPHQALLRALGRARAKDLQPGREEVYLSHDSLRLLAAMVDRPAEQLVRALPNLRAEHLIHSPGRRLRIAQWPDEPGAGPLKACPLCLEEGAWLVAGGRRWRPCGCGRRWQCGDDGGYLIDTTPLPDVGRALLRHRAFDHRLGPAGDALVADAHQVMLWWWASKQVARGLWREREDALHVGPKLRRRQAAPAVVYPEAMDLAEAMNQWEELRGKEDTSQDDWLAAVAARFGVPGIAGGRESEPLRYWLQLHAPEPGRTPASRSKSKPERRWAQLPTLHHPPGDRGPFQANSCLRWVFGRHLTSISQLCPYCHGHELSCRWVPSPDCPVRLRQ